ncbi:amino acid permease [Acidisoma cellulosilytica]|uniref:Amino acid permease n=1 Tax=Acidisoma cellulosilyticum TaxID=2802395 RepID=A0A963Z8C7_9PROT|nr:amino acid permease [Acidisoma cellulosilyticum]MCB8883737.1 amino acid permease [Acidisoma cellulosilyticum]
MDKFDDQVVDNDTEILQKFGYTQELRRLMSSFGNFAMSFMVIGVFWCACINMQQGIGSAGMFGVSVGWLIGSAIAVSTALSLAEIASAIPTAGGLYHWSSVFGGRGWGWATAWLNLLAYTFSVAGTAVAIYLLFTQMILGWVLHIDTSSWGYWHQVVGVVVIVTSQAILNHVGVRTLARFGEFGAYMTFIGAVALLSILLYNIHPQNLEHIFTFTNNTGTLGGDVVPHTGNIALVLGYAILLPMWIITSYDASAHTSEETIDAARAVPRAMVQSASFSALLGIVIFTALGLAMADQDQIAKQGANAFSVMFGQTQAPTIVKDFIAVALVVASYVCGTCCLTGFSRAIFAFARDRGLPSALRLVSHKYRTPAVAIWCGAILAVCTTLYSSAFSALIAGTALFYQLSYGMAICAALFSKHHIYGPFRLGGWSKLFRIIGIVGGVYVIWVGLQPPTQVLLNYFIGILLLLAIGWFAIERRRFPGPPLTPQLLAVRRHDLSIENTVIGDS